LDNKEKDTNDLIKACLKHDQAAQFQLYKQYSNAMYSTTVRMLGNNEDAEDALQDAFVNAFKNLKKFDGRVTFGAWLKRITINVCLNKLRKKQLKWLELDFDIPDPHEAEEEEMKIDPADLNAAIEKLPSGCKTVFTLKAFEGYKHEEIAQELKISLSTSKSQFVRAKKLLNFSLKKLVQL
jgi:RNA polymerase sigma-70 factor (ECF subfamily)